MSASPVVSTEPQDLLSLAREAAEAAKGLVAEATRRVRATVLSDEGKISAEKMETAQHATHGLAWTATYAEGVRELAAYAHSA
jgi:(2S)-methylsuccinyl-CoA dehydrogenase